ncbi:MAG: indole-3-glycerol phosphate synthase TrpC [Oscillospiraceae bacterium]
MILDDICIHRKEQLEREIAHISRKSMKTRAKCADFPALSFRDALKKDCLSVICEVKKASPSKGLIKPDFHPVEIAKEYENAGANAISCLTEEFYFKGSSKYLSDIRKEVNIPILRKDFIIDEYQIYEAKAIGANAILLIAAILSAEQMKEFQDLAHSLSLQCLVEVHNQQELEKVLTFTPDVLGINNRNLKTFEVDLNTTAKVRKNVPCETVLVSESGIKNNEDMNMVRSLGADAVLIGETLMRSENITTTLHQLREGV